MKEDLRVIEKLYQILCDSDHPYHAAGIEYAYKNHRYSLVMETISFKGYHDGSQCICWINVGDSDISREIELAELIQKTDFLTWADDLWRQYIETGMI